MKEQKRKNNCIRRDLRHVERYAAKIIDRKSVKEIVEISRKQTDVDERWQNPEKHGKQNGNGT